MEPTRRRHRAALLWALLLVATLQRPALCAELPDAVFHATQGRPVQVEQLDGAVTEGVLLSFDDAVLVLTLPSGRIITVERTNIRTFSMVEPQAPEPAPVAAAPAIQAQPVEVDEPLPEHASDHDAKKPTDPEALDLLQQKARRQTTGSAVGLGIGGAFYLSQFATYNIGVRDFLAYGAATSVVFPLLGARVGLHGAGWQGVRALGGTPRTGLGTAGVWIIFVGYTSCSIGAVVFSFNDKSPSGASHLLMQAGAPVALLGGIFALADQAKAASRFSRLRDDLDLAQGDPRPRLSWQPTLEFDSHKASLGVRGTW